MKNVRQRAFKIVTQGCTSAHANFQPWRWPGRSFSSLFRAPRKSKKKSHFLKTYYFQLFQALGPFSSSSPCPKHILQCPPWSLGPSGVLVLTIVFLRQKFHFREFVAILKFSPFSGPGSFNHAFSGTPQYVGPRRELLRWSGARDRRGGTHDFKGFEDFW